MLTFDDITPVHNPIIKALKDQFLSADPLTKLAIARQIINARKNAYTPSESQNYTPKPIAEIESKISIRFNNAEVKDVCIDDEFGNVTATVNGLVNTDCGFIEDYRFNSEPSTNNQSLPESQSRRDTSDFYEYNPDRKPAQRKRENAAAIALLKQFRNGDFDETTITDEQRAILAKYSGLGGALIGEDGQKGSAYEYYTPKPIAEGVWDLAKELGFSGGKVLDPCGGVGIFGATAPLNAVIDAVELVDILPHLKEGDSYFTRSEYVSLLLTGFCC